MTDDVVDGAGEAETDDEPDDKTEENDETEPQDWPEEDEFFQEGTFNDWLGLEVAEFGGGRAVLTVDAEEYKRNPGGVVHGGVTATLIDVAGGIAIGTAEAGPNDVQATTNLDVHYLRPVTDTATATAEVVRIGSSNAVAHVEVEADAPSGERKQVAIGTVTYQRG